MWLIFIALVGYTSATPSSSLECGACTLIISRSEFRIAQINPEKMIEVGSFRVSPDGKQKGLKQIPYARSEAHLTEILEKICDDTQHYKLIINPITGKKVYAHNASTYIKGEDGKGMQSKLHNACNDLIDSSEDEIITFLKTSHEDAVKEYCHVEIGACTAVDVAPLPPDEPPARVGEEL